MYGITEQNATHNTAYVISLCDLQYLLPFFLFKNGTEELQELLCQNCKKGLVHNTEQSVEEHWISNKTVIRR